MSPSRPVRKKPKLSLPKAGFGERWDEYHSDPTQDVTIKAKDGVLFKASSYRLSQVSTVLAGMFEICTNETIDMPYNSTAVRILLDFAALQRLPDTRRQEIETAFDVHTLVRFYDCDVLEYYAGVMLTHSTTNQPLSYLLFASNANDVSMACEALKAGRATNRLPDSAEILRIIPLLRPAWTARVMQMMMKARADGIGLYWPTPHAIEAFKNDMGEGEGQ